jgi:hypothetical protein
MRKSGGQAVHLESCHFQSLHPPFLLEAAFLSHLQFSSPYGDISRNNEKMAPPQAINLLSPIPDKSRLFFRFFVFHLPTIGILISAEGGGALITTTVGPSVSGPPGVFFIEPNDRIQGFRTRYYLYRSFVVQIHWIPFSL